MDSFGEPFVDSDCMKADYLMSLGAPFLFGTHFESDWAFCNSCRLKIAPPFLWFLGENLGGVVCCGNTFLGYDLPCHRFDK